MINSPDSIFHFIYSVFVVSNGCTMTIPKIINHCFSKSTSISHCTYVKQFPLYFLYSRGGSRTVAISKMKRFLIIVNGWKPLTIIAVNYYQKALHLGCCSSPRSAFDNLVFQLRIVGTFLFYLKCILY